MPTLGDIDWPDLEEPPGTADNTTISTVATSGWSTVGLLAEDDATPDCHHLSVALEPLGDTPPWHKWQKWTCLHCQATGVCSGTGHPTNYGT